MKPQNDIIEKAGIEIVGGEYGSTTIHEELETRYNTRRKINRSIEYASGTNNYCGEVFEFSLPDILKMKEENDYYIKKLVDLTKEISPFKDIVPVCSNKFEPGAILTDSWGWEQTNIDFYCIVKRAGIFVTVMPMTKHTSEEKGFMTKEEMPGQIDFTASPQRKKIQLSSRGEEYGFSFHDYAGGGYCRLWDGEKETSTHYA